MTPLEGELPADYHQSVAEGFPQIPYVELQLQQLLVLPGFLQQRDLQIWLPAQLPHVRCVRDVGSVQYLLGEYRTRRSVFRVWSEIVLGSGELARFEWRMRKLRVPSWWRKNSTDELYLVRLRLGKVDRNAPLSTS